MSNEVYHAGVARADITPPVGIRLIGYIVREGVSQGVDEPLTATVLVLRGGGHDNRDHRSRLVHRVHGFRRQNA